MATENKDDDLVMVGDGVEEGDQKEIAAVDEEKEEKKGDGEGEDDGEDDGEGAEQHADDDVRVGSGEVVDDEKIEARRVERKARRTRQKTARDRDQRELKFLRSRNEQVEKQLNVLAKRQDVSETATIDGRISQLENAVRSAEDVYAQAITASEGKDAAEAMSIRDKLMEQISGLKSYKKQQEDSSNEAEVVPDPVFIQEVQTWSKRNVWYDFARRDEDSAIAGAIDDMMVKDGWDPRTPEYYTELDKRIARRLPDRAVKTVENDDDDDDGKGKGKGKGEGEGRRPAGGPKFRVGGQDRILKSNEVHVSRDRREAMEEAGIWDDPPARKRQLAAYAKWDRENVVESA